ncbi:MAG: ice-binding family protein [Candidatus Moranbacteria bacterium]|nr:ice-binding family protein [Candidatus Moranbacteria bacterium]
MKIYIKVSVVALAVALVVGPAGSMTTHAATTPGLGQAASFVILSSTYTNTAGGTTLTGDLGYTTGPAVAPTVNGSTFSPPSIKYSQAGIDQASALASLNGETCTAIAGPLNAVIVGGNPAGTFPPGCYETTGAMTITLSTTVTLDLTAAGAVGSTWVFRAAGGTLTTGADAIVALANGASSCDVFWAPTGATTLGANTTFKGTVIDAAGITIGSTVGWVGRALAFGGTISTDTDTISSTSCTAATSAAAAAADEDVSDTSGHNDKNTDKKKKKKAPKLPATGVAFEERSASWNTSALAGALILVSTSLVVVARKRAL